jgi:hypothetical protein
MNRGLTILLAAGVAAHRASLANGAAEPDRSARFCLWRNLTAFTNPELFERSGK